MSTASRALVVALGLVLSTSQLSAQNLAPEEGYQGWQGITLGPVEGAAPNSTAAILADGTRLVGGQCTDPNGQQFRDLGGFPAIRWDDGTFLIVAPRYADNVIDVYEADCDDPEILCNGVDDDCDSTLRDNPTNDPMCPAICSAGAVEICNNGIDDDCDPATVDVFDGDGDGDLCDVDCNDADPTIGPSKAEIYNDGIDQNCYDYIFEELGSEDLDSDGYIGTDDCDDRNNAVNPGATEIACNGIDDDCNPNTPDGPDGDGDGWAACGGDCNDANPDVSPGHAEVCDNGVDDDCNAATLDRFDADGDGATCDVDCNDGNPFVRPGRAEICGNGIEDDCNAATADVGDNDGDGFACDEDCDDTSANVRPHRRLLATFTVPFDAVNIQGSEAYWENQRRWVTADDTHLFLPMPDGGLLELDLASGEARMRVDAEALVERLTEVAESFFGDGTPPFIDFRFSGVLSTQGRLFTALIADYSSARIGAAWIAEIHPDGQIDLLSNAVPYTREMDLVLHPTRPHVIGLSGAGPSSVVMRMAFMDLSTEPLVAHNVDASDAAFAVSNASMRAVPVLGRESMLAIFQPGLRAFDLNLDVFDSEGDGLAYNAELAAGTVPGGLDSDGDGVPDGAEAFLFGSDPTTADVSPATPLGTLAPTQDLTDALWPLRNDRFFARGACGSACAGSGGCGGAQSPGPGVCYDALGEPTVIPGNGPIMGALGDAYYSMVPLGAGSQNPVLHRTEFGAVEGEVGTPVVLPFPDQVGRYRPMTDGSFLYLDSKEVYRAMPGETTMPEPVLDIQASPCLFTRIDPCPSWALSSGFNAMRLTAIGHDEITDAVIFALQRNASIDDMTIFAFDGVTPRFLASSSWWPRLGVLQSLRRNVADLGWLATFELNDTRPSTLLLDDGLQPVDRYQPAMPIPGAEWQDFFMRADTRAFKVRASGGGGSVDGCAATSGGTICTFTGAGGPPEPSLVYHNFSQRLVQVPPQVKPGDAFLFVTEYTPIDSPAVDYQAWQIWRYTGEEAEHLWLDRARFYGFADEAGRTSIDATELGDVTGMSVRPDGGELCVVESGRTWLIDLTVYDPPDVIRLHAPVSDVVDCEYSPNGELVTLHTGPTRLEGAVSASFEGVTSPEGVERVADTLIVFDSGGATARCVDSQTGEVADSGHAAYALAAIGEEDAVLWIQSGTDAALAATRADFCGGNDATYRVFESFFTKTDNDEPLPEASAWIRLFSGGLQIYTRTRVEHADLMVRPDGRVYFATTDIYLGETPPTTRREPQDFHDVMWRVRAPWFRIEGATGDEVSSIESWRRANPAIRNALRYGTRVTALARVPGNSGAPDWERWLGTPEEQSDQEPVEDPDDPSMMEDTPDDPADESDGSCCSNVRAPAHEPAVGLLLLGLLAVRRRYRG